MFNFNILQCIQYQPSDIHYLIDCEEKIFSIELFGDVSKLKKELLNDDGYSKAYSLSISTKEGNLNIIEVFLGLDTEPLYYAFEDCLELKRKLLLNENKLYLIGLISEKSFGSLESLGLINNIARIDTVYDFELLEEECFYDSTFNSSYYVTCYSQDYLSVTLGELYKDKMADYSTIKDTFKMQNIFDFFNISFEKKYDIQSFIDILENKNKFNDF